MSFSSQITVDQARTGAGELGDAPAVVLTANTFENKLPVGVFAKLEAGSLDRLDSSADPVIAGVVLRSLGMPLDTEHSTYDSSLISSVEYVRQGLVQVHVVAGQTPTQFGTVTVLNVAGPNAGEGYALADGTGVAVDAEFIREVSTNVWLIRIW